MNNEFITGAILILVITVVLLLFKNLYNFIKK
jgi:hypothetical protein